MNAQLAEIRRYMIHSERILGPPGSGSSAARLVAMPTRMICVTIVTRGAESGPPAPDAVVTAWRAVLGRLSAAR